MSSEVPSRAELIEGMFRAGRELSTATIMFHQVIADQLGLHATDHKCADLLQMHGPMTAGKLAVMTGLTTGAITGVIDRLEKCGYVRRLEDSSDRRRVLVQAEPQCHEEIAPLFQSLGAIMVKICEHYDDRQLATILDFQLQARQGLHEATLELRQKQVPAKRPKQPRSGK